MIESEDESPAAVKAIDESTLTKGQLRKLSALRKSVGADIGERAFAEWLASQAKAEKADKNLETIVDALWPLVRQGRLQIRRGGYLVGPCASWPTAIPRRAIRSSSSAASTRTCRSAPATAPRSPGPSAPRRRLPS